MLKSKFLAATWSLVPDLEQFVLKARSKAMALMRRPRPAFLAWAAERRIAGNLVGRLLGISLRKAALQFTIKVGALTVNVQVQCGKLKGDYHGLEFLLGVNLNGINSCPLGFAEKDWSDWSGWMNYIKEHGTMSFDKYLLLARELDKAADQRVNLGFAEVASMACASPLLAGDSDTPAAERALAEVGDIMADPMHVFMALIRNLVFEVAAHLNGKGDETLRLQMQTVRKNDTWKEEMSGHYWGVVLMEYERIILPACIASNEVAQAASGAAKGKGAVEIHLVDCTQHLLFVRLRLQK